MNYQILKKLINKDSIKYYVIFIFFTHQIFYISKIGTQIDEYIHIKGVELTLEKIKKIIDGSAFIDYLNYSDIEFYGYLYEIQVYFFSNLPLFKNLISNFNFIVNEIDAVYFLRHFYLNLYLVLFLFIIHFYISKIMDTKTANIFIVILTLNPIFIGHSMFNHKDITFAIHIFLAFLAYLYYSDKFIIENSLESWRINLITSIFIVYPILLRFNAIAFLFLFILSYFVTNFKLLPKHNFLMKNFKLGFSSFILLLMGSLPGWPNLIYYYKSLYNTQFKYAWEGNTVINGIYYFSTDFKFNYIIKVLIYKLPIPILIFLILGLYTVYKLKIKLLINLYLFLFLFLMSFYLFKPTYYDYFRQYLFLIPIISFLIAIIFSKNFNNNSFQINLNLLFFCVFSIYSQFGLQEFKYTYLNEFVQEENIANLSNNCPNGESICGKWSTDYYGISGKQIITNLQLNDKNFAFSCFYDHTIDDFLFEGSTNLNDSSKFNFEGFNYLKNNFDFASNLLENKFINEIYIIDVHRVGIGNCVDRFTKNYNCTLDNLVSRSYRGNKVFMAYVHKCVNY